MRINTIFRFNRHDSDREGTDKYMITVDDGTVTEDDVRNQIARSGLKNRIISDLIEMNSLVWMVYFENNES